jgi:LPS sulfotransferase NodH
MTQDSPKQTNCICILTVPRTGSGHLCKVLNNFPGFAAFFELFARTECRGLLRHVPAPFVSIRARHDKADPALVALAQNRPRVFLDRVARFCFYTGKPNISLKFMPAQLTPKIIESEILGRPRTRALLLTRRAIDSYISKLKAHQVSRHRNTDTTNLKVTLDAGKFMNWHARKALWYDHWQAWHRAKGLALPIMRYEDDISPGVGRTLTRFAELAEQAGMELRIPASLKTEGMSRQDLSRNTRDKVANWAEFEKQLSRRGASEKILGPFV